jgi:chromate transporter
VQAPLLASLDWGALALTAAALIALLRWNVGVVTLVAACAVAGVALRAV